MGKVPLPKPRGGALEGGLRLIARPLRRQKAGRSGIAIQPYRGYGTAEEILLTGHVLKQSGATRGGNGGLLDDLRDAYRRLTRDAVANVTLTAWFQSTRQTVSTDSDGFFELRMPVREPLPATRLWHPVQLETVHGGEIVRATGEVFVPPATASMVIISDIDDTVVETGVANKLRMLWTMFTHGAESRVAYPGVGAFYRALFAGRSGTDLNPILYVSRGPWTLYDVLDEFFALQGIPVGPILFLREWGISWRRPLPRRAVDHKRDLIEEMLKLYAPLPFVLIGDSGQKDPEIYARVVEDHPNRISAVYIRNVSRRRARSAAVKALAARVVETGSTMVLSDDTAAMAEHALQHGLIRREAAAAVAGEKESDRAEAGAQEAHAPPQVQVQADSPEQTESELEAASDSGRQGEAETPTVRIEPSRDYERE